MNENKRDKGITLIALVVTIIVLMILSGVTLRVLSGDDGIIEEAKLVLNSYESVSDDEDTKLDYTRNKLKQLKESRQNRNGGGSEQGNSGELSITIMESNGTLINLENIANYYGREVTYNGEIYQLFYVDTEGKYSNEEPRIWLQHKEYVGGVKLSDHFETTGLADTNSIMYQINPGWKELIGNDLVGKTDEQLNVDEYSNYRGVAYLCNPDNWNDEYLEEGDEEKGVFAIGGVSVEMWCDSYNAARNKISTEADYFSAKAYSQNSTKGYRFKPGGADASTNGEGYGYWTDNVNYPITTFYGNMYKISGDYYPWISSPASNNTRVCVVNCSTADLSRLSTTANRGVRPAVSLPASIQIKLNVLTEID